MQSRVPLQHYLIVVTQTLYPRWLKFHSKLRRMLTERAPKLFGCRCHSSASSVYLCLESAKQHNMTTDALREEHEQLGRVVTKLISEHAGLLDSTPITSSATPDELRQLFSEPLPV